MKKKLVVAFFAGVITAVVLFSVKAVALAMMNQVGSAVSVPFQINGEAVE